MIKSAAMACERGLLLSVDGQGVFGSWKAQDELIRPLVDKFGLNKQYRGFEVYDWRRPGSPSIDRKIQKARSAGIMVGGLHLRTAGVLDDCSSFSASGLVNKLKVLFGVAKLAGLNELMNPTLKSILDAGWMTEYCLIHGPEARKNGFIQALAANPNLVKLLLVEPHSNVGCTGMAWGVGVELAYLGVNTGLMLDLRHIYGGREYIRDEKKRVGLLIRVMESTFLSAAKNGFSEISLHVPLGIDMSDSLPNGSLRTVILQEVANLVNDLAYKDMVKRIVIEGQRGLPDALWLPPGHYYEYQYYWAPAALASVVESGLLGN